MITRILIGLLGASAIAILVLSLMLRSANASLMECTTSAVVKEAVAKQAASVAERAVAAADTLALQQAVLQKEIKLLHDHLDAIQTKRPHYNARPRPTDADGHRSSILRAVRQ